MPEGDTIFRAARTLQRALAGRIVTRFESVFPRLTRIDHDRPLAGRTIDRVTSRGKHLLMFFSGDLILHTHMRMHGSWHIYKPGERWRARRHDMRIVVATDAYVAVGFNIPVAELLAPAEFARHELLQTLGPDLAAVDFDRRAVVERLRARGAEAIEEALLNQRVLSGIGNVLKSEVLFVSHVNPFTAVSALDDETIDRIVDAAQRLMKMNMSGASSNAPIGRRTTGSLDPSAKLFVYGRAGKRCRVCGTAIEMRKSGVHARSTYWCPRCQPELPAGVI
jgi:endonuclease-8